MLLANGEAVIKNWEYATSKVNGKWTKSTLIITNKRIVATAKNSRRVDQQEIPLRSVKGVYCRQEKPAIALAILCLIIGIVVTVMGIMSFPTQNMEEMGEYGMSMAMPQMILTPIIGLIIAIYSIV